MISSSATTQRGTQRGTQRVPAIKRVRSLRHRKAREESGLFVVEGIRLVAEALALDAGIETCVIAPELLSGEFGRRLDARIKDAGLPRLEVTPAVFESLSSRDGPQGIAAVVRQRWEELEDIDPSNDFCWVALDATQDPGNVGTILRTTDAVGAGGVILLGPATDPYDPSAVRASMGAIFSQRLVRAQFDRLVRWSRRHGCMLVGMAPGPKGTPRETPKWYPSTPADLVEYREPRYQPPIVLLGGSEREGLSQEQQESCDVVVKIPMVGRSDSLNLAVATGVVLYELFNRR